MKKIIIKVLDRLLNWLDPQPVTPEERRAIR